MYDGTLIMSSEAIHRRSTGDDAGTKRAITEKLRLLKSPVVESDGSGDELPPVGAGLPDLSQYGKRPGPLRDMPEFKRVSLPIPCCDAHTSGLIDIGDSTKMPVSWSCSLTCSSRRTTRSFRRRSP